MKTTESDTKVLLGYLSVYIRSIEFVLLDTKNYEEKLSSL